MNKVLMWWSALDKGHPAGYILAQRFGSVWFGKLCSTHHCVHPLDSGMVEGLMNAGQLALLTLPSPGRTYFQKEF